MPAQARELVDELDRRPDDIVLTKRGWSAFSAERLNERPREASVTEVVVVVGPATGYGIELTARQAYDLGYSVVIVIDAINNRQRESHDTVSHASFPRSGSSPPPTRSSRCCRTLDRPPDAYEAYRGCWFSGRSGSLAATSGSKPD